MTNRTIKTNDLNDGDTFVINGVVSYSRITEQLAGKALEIDATNRTNRGMRPITKPYTSITIDQAQVQVANPNQLTNVERFAQESLYQSRSANSQGGLTFTAVNKSRNLPWTMVAINGNATERKLDGELAVGVRVAVVCRIFAAPQNNGVNLEGVVVLEEPRYYQRQSNARDEAFKLLQMNYETNPAINWKAETPQKTQSEETFNSQPYWEQGQNQAPVNLPAPQQFPPNNEQFVPNAPLPANQPMPWNNQPLNNPSIPAFNNQGMPAQPQGQPQAQVQAPVNNWQIPPQGGGIRYNPMN